MPKGEYSPIPGVRVWKNKRDVVIFRLHYSADPNKTPEWAAREKMRMADDALYQQEYEIDFGSTGGSLIYQYTPEATEEDEFPVPHSWTRRMALDPHPVKPHASLWGATDPYGILHIYREFWPSKVYNMGAMVPENDNRVSVKEYVECVKFLESAENVQNSGKAENIYERVIDYAARAFGKGTSDDNPDEQSDFQTRFEREADAIDLDFRFRDAKKDMQVGIELVNAMLKPSLMEEDPKTGVFRPRSQIRIMRERCPELIWQLKNNRRKNSTAQQAENDDPTMRLIRKKNDLSDCSKYLLRNGIEYVDPAPDRTNSWIPSQEGISY